MESSMNRWKIGAMPKSIIGKIVSIIDTTLTNNNNNNICDHVYQKGSYTCSLRHFWPPFKGYSNKVLLPKVKQSTFT